MTTKGSVLVVGSRLGAVLLGLLAGCGDVPGDAISVSGQGMNAAGAGGQPPGASGGSGQADLGWLCEPCERSADCGGPDDRCLVDHASGDQFCSRACSATDSCPAPFDCLLVEMPDGSLRAQCVPPGGSCEGLLGPSGCPPLAELRAYNLFRLNEIRANLGLPALVVDDCLNQIAQQANHERIATGEPNGKFARECLPVVPECECNWQQENMGHSLGSERSWQENFDVVLELMMSDPGSIQHQNIISTQWSRVGLGAFCQQDGHEIYFTNDFGV